MIQLIEKLDVIRTCKHTAEVEAQYDDSHGQEFRMYRDCRNEEKYHKRDKDNVRIVRPHRPDAAGVGCLKHGSGTDSCGCKANRILDGRTGAARNPKTSF